jgi:hypothetical protein
LRRDLDLLARYVAKVINPRRKRDLEKTLCSGPSCLDWVLFGLVVGRVINRGPFLWRGVLVVNSDLSSDGIGGGTIFNIAVVGQLSVDAGLDRYPI